MTIHTLLSKEAGLPLLEHTVQESYEIQLLALSS